MEKNYRWYKITGDEREIPFRDNGMAVVEVNGKKVSLGRRGDKLFAFAYLCPHASGILAEGWLDAKGYVVCPVHKYRFDMENGRNVTGEGYHLKHWLVERREEGVFLRIEDGSF